MNSIKIEIPKGWQVESFDKKSGEVKFKEIPKSITERIKSWDDVLKVNNLTVDSFNESCEGLESDEIAYRQIKLIAKTLNEGWQPDWSNNDEYKYYAWFEMAGSSGFRFAVFDLWYAHSDCGSRLCFKSSKLAKYAGETFTDIYKKFMLI